MIDTETEAANTHRYVFDYLRVIACFGIIGIHAMGYLSFDSSVGTQVVGAVVEVIVRLSLPIFFLMSGALLLNGEDIPLGEFYRKRFLRILPAFIFFSLLYCFVSEYGLSHLFSVSGIKDLLFSLGSYLRNILAEPVAGHLWFVYCLVGLYLIIPFLKKMLKNMNEKWVIELLMVIMIIRCCIDYAPVIGLEINLDSDYFIFGGWVLYFFIGYFLVQPYASKHYRKIELAGFLSFLLMIILYALFPLFTEESFFTSPFAKNFFDLAPLEIITVAGIVSCALSLERRPKGIKGNRHIDLIMKKVSSHTYSLYLVHILVLSYLVKFSEGWATIPSLSLTSLAFLMSVTFLLSLALAWICDTTFIRALMWASKRCLATIIYATTSVRKIMRKHKS